MKNIKILYISHISELNGAPRSLLNLAEEIRAYNITPVVILPSQGPLARELRARKIKYYIIDYVLCCFEIGGKFNIKDAIINEYTNFAAAVEIIRIIKKEGIHIVHSNSAVIDAGAVAAYWSGIPHVWHIREFMKEDFHLKFYFKWKVQYLLRHSKKVLAVSDCVAQKYKMAYKLKNIKRIYNGLPVQQYLIEKDEKEVLKEEKKLEIIMCGSLCEGKGQMNAIEAMEYLKEIKDMRLYIIGDGNIQYEKSLKKAVLEKGLSDRVIFLGRLSNLLQVRKRADIELVCSKAEAFGRVTIEAMLGQVLVIGACTAGTYELIEDGTNGLLYREGDSRDLAAKIYEVYMNRGKYRKVVEMAQQYAKDKFSICITAKNVYEIYKEVLRNKLRD